MPPFLKYILFINAALDFCLVTPFVKGVLLRPMFDTDHLPAAQIELIIDVIAYNFLLHGAVRLMAGIYLDKPEFRMLGALSYILESISGGILILKYGTDFVFREKVFPIAFGPWLPLILLLLHVPTVKRKST